MKKLLTSIIFLIATPLFIFRDALGIHFCQDEFYQMLMIAPFLMAGGGVIKYKWQQILTYVKGDKHVDHSRSQDACCTHAHAQGETTRIHRPTTSVPGDNGYRAN